MKNVEKIKPTGLFTNYIYKAIPLAFDESMSYYEALCGLLSYLKDTVIPTVNNNADAIIEVQSLMTQLQDYVDNYFDNLDVQQEINNKLDEMVIGGELQQLLSSQYDELKNDVNNEITEFKNDINNQIVAINNKVNVTNTGNPIPVTNTNQMTDTTKIYLLISDGKWYYYNGTTWVAGGTYQSTSIGENCIIIKY